MKNKLLFTVLMGLIINSTSVLSQVNKYIIGVESGIGISSLRPSIADHSARVGFTEAVSGQYNFSEQLAVKTGLGYELKGCSGTVPLEVIPIENGTYYENFHFLTLPVLAKINFENKIKYFGTTIKYFVNSGPYLSFLLKQNHKIAATEYSAESKTNNTDYYKRLEFGWTLGAGLVYTLNEKMGLSVELRDNFGINNLNDADKYNGISLRTNAAYFLVGFAYSL